MNQAELKEQIVVIADNLIASGEYTGVDARTLQQAGISADGRKLVAAMKSLVVDGVMYRDEAASGAWFGLVDMGIDEEEETWAAENGLVQNEQGEWIIPNQEADKKKVKLTREERALQKFYETDSVGKAAMASGMKKAAVRDYLDSLGIEYTDNTPDKAIRTRNAEERAIDAYVRTGNVDKAAMASGYGKTYTIILLISRGEMQAPIVDGIKRQRAIEKFVETADFKKAAMASGLKKWDVIAILTEEGHL
jgi:hypothetical protein